MSTSNSTDTNTKLLWVIAVSVVTALVIGVGVLIAVNLPEAKPNPVVEACQSIRDIDYDIDSLNRFEIEANYEECLGGRSDD